MPPRLVPELPLPPYAYVSGQFPHPTSDPAGHSFGRTPQNVAPPDPDRPHSSREYLFGCDLFNHGYYWEAHEEWEGLWHACGRRGPLADFLKALIHLAAAGVKAREHRAAGVRRHAVRAVELFTVSSGRFPSGHCLGLEFGRLVVDATHLQTHAMELAKTGGTTEPTALPGLGFYLVPRDTPATGSALETARD